MRFIYWHNREFESKGIPFDTNMYVPEKHPDTGDLL